MLPLTDSLLRVRHYAKYFSQTQDLIIAVQFTPDYTERDQEFHRCDVTCLIKVWWLESEDQGLNLGMSTSDIYVVSLIPNGSISPLSHIL